MYIFFFFLQSMKNVTCRKLVIDRSKVPEKLSTLKDISLCGSFEFPISGPYNGGIIARSLAGTEKELKKTSQQLRSLSNRSCPIAGATGAPTTEEIPFHQESPNVSGDRRHDVYSVKFIQHKMEHQNISVSLEMVDTDEMNENLLKAGFALKIGGAKRTVFSLQQKEVMIVTGFALFCHWALGPTRSAQFPRAARSTPRVLYHQFSERFILRLL